MSGPEAVLLGAIAGFTIFLGLPLARMKRGGMGLRTFLNGLSAGVLIFLLIEIVEHAIVPVEEAVEESEWSELAKLAPALVIGLVGGLIGLLYVSKLWRERRPRGSMGPGAAAVVEMERTPEQSEAMRVGMSIAMGIGLHNFSEGLAIGATSLEKTSLALLLVIGFALHNATEGFGIAGPLLVKGVRPSWTWLVVAGLVGGGPTFLGTIAGRGFESDVTNVAFLSLAAGAILYVVGELFNAGRRLSWEITLWGVLAGFFLGFGTELVLEVAGF